MRILHVYKSYYPEDYGGVPQAIRHLVTGCAEYGINAEVFTFSPKAGDHPTEFEGQRVTQAKTVLEVASTPLSIDAFSKFRNIASKCDLVHYHYPYPFADLLHLFCGRHIPSIVTYHSDIVRQRFLKYPYYPIQTAFLHSVDRIVCTSTNYMNTSPVLRQFAHKTEAISLGLEKSYFPKASAEVLSKWRSHIRAPFILFLGAIRQYKGIDTLIAAAKGFNFKLIIAGDGANLDNHKQTVSQEGLTNIDFIGRINEHDKAALLELCTALVLPSHYRSEAFGLVQLEASMNQKPLICTELGTGTSYVNKHEITGIVVPPKDADALQNAMNFMMYNPDIAKKMGIAAEGRFRKLFTSKKMCQNYSRIYNEVVSQAKGLKA